MYFAKFWFFGGLLIFLLNPLTGVNLFFLFITLWTLISLMLFFFRHWWLLYLMDAFRQPSREEKLLKSLLIFSRNKGFRRPKIFFSIHTNTPIYLFTSKSMVVIWPFDESEQNLTHDIQPISNREMKNLLNQQSLLNLECFLIKLFKFFLPQGWHRALEIFLKAVINHKGLSS